MAENRENADREFDAAAQTRRAAERRLSMSERLARLHELSKQLSAIRGTAAKR